MLTWDKHRPSQLPSLAAAWPNTRVCWGKCAGLWHGHTSFSLVLVKTIIYHGNIPLSKYSWKEITKKYR